MLKRDKERMPELAALRQTPADEERFLAQLRRRLHAVKKEERASAGFLKTFALPRVAWALSGAVVGVASTWLVLATISPSSNTQTAARVSQAQSTPRQAAEDSETWVANAPSVPQSKVALIKIVFNSDVSVQDVEFSIELPEGVAFWHDGALLEEKALSWKGKLDAGENVIPVAVRGTTLGQHRVHAKAFVGDKLMQHDIVFTVTEEI